MPGFVSKSLPMELFDGNQESSDFSLLPGLGRVPNGPRAHRTSQSLRSVRTASQDDARSHRQDPKSHPFAERVRRPSPVPDRGNSRRQCPVYIKSEEATPNGGAQANSPANHQPEDTPYPLEAQAATRRSDASRNSKLIEDGRLFLSEDSSGSEDTDHDENSSSEPEGRSDGQCQCPISLQCPNRKNSLLDCRTLALEAGWRAHSERIMSEIGMFLEVAKFTYEARVREIFLYWERIKARPSQQTLKRIFDEMTVWVLEMLTKSVTQATLDSTHVLQLLEDCLEPIGGEAEYFRQRAPSSLIEELTVLYRKWRRGDFLADTTRGLKFKVNLNRTGSRNAKPAASIDKNWPHRLYDKFYGHGHLVNGQRWRSRIEMSRDGAHGPIEAGIAGSVQEGARSVVMGFHDDINKKYYADVDRKDTIYYMGTALPRKEHDESATNEKDSDTARSPNNKSKTLGTCMLFRSIETRRPVRVFRSFKLAPINTYRPVEGYRYDGLYRVVKAKRMKKERQIYRFTMKRLGPNEPDSGRQGPLRAGIQESNTESIPRRQRRDLNVLSTRTAGRSARERSRKRRRTQ